jgi:hypothetical protein
MSKTAANPGADAGTLNAIGAVGNAYNAGQATRDAQKMNLLQLEQLRQNVAFNEEVRRRQAAMAAQEVERQQIMARASGDAFQGSVDRFRAPAEAGVGDATSQIARLYQDYMSRPSPVQAVMPAASGPAAEREASMRQKASADVRGEGERLAAVQGFGQYMNDNSRAMATNEQLAALINNFSRGSAGASAAEVGAEGGNFIRERLVAPQKSSLGDMFVGFASMYANNRAQNPEQQYGLQPQDYSLLPPGAQAPGGYGARMPRAGGDYGVQLPTDLGIGRTR